MHSLQLVFYPWEWGDDLFYFDTFLFLIFPLTLTDASMGECTSIKKPGGLSHAFSWQHLCNT